MKKFLAVFGAVLTVGILTVPAYAAPSLYISGDAGSSWFNDIKPNDPLAASEVGTVTTTAGINVLGAIGLKWCNTGGVNPYLTAGIGLAEVGLHGVPNPPDTFNETHGALGYQFGAGLSIPLNKNVDFDVCYRYFRTSTVSLDNNEGSLQIASNSIFAGLRVGL